MNCEENKQVCRFISKLNLEKRKGRENPGINRRDLKLRKEKKNPINPKTKFKYMLLVRVRGRMCTCTCPFLPKVIPLGH